MLEVGDGKKRKKRRKLLFPDNANGRVRLWLTAWPPMALSGEQFLNNLFIYNNIDIIAMLARHFLCPFFPFSGFHSKSDAEA